MKAAEGMAWVDVLLAQWGRRAIRCESGALGFASSCLAGASGDGDGYDSSVPRGVGDGDVAAVDSAVMRLPVILIACVVQVYQVGAGRPDSENARVLGVSYKTLTQFIWRAQRKIALDISLPCTQNPHPSANGESSAISNQPVPVHA